MAEYNSSFTGAQHDSYVTKNQLIDLIYPIGSFYISANSTSPATLFGGTWTQIKDKFILAAGDNYTAGDTGGEATHKLTTTEMPNHTHILYGGDNTGEPDWFGGSNANYLGYTGGDGAHNNMPPYLVIYMWQRIA